MWPLLTPAHWHCINRLFTLIGPSVELSSHPPCLPGYHWGKAVFSSHILLLSNPFHIGHADTTWQGYAPRTYNLVRNLAVTVWKGCPLSVTWVCSKNSSKPLGSSHILMTCSMMSPFIDGQMHYWLCGLRGNKPEGMWRCAFLLHEKSQTDLH